MEGHCLKGDETCKCKIREDWATGREKWKGLCKTCYPLQGDGGKGEVRKVRIQKVSKTNARLVTEVKGDRQSKTSCSKVDGHVQNF